MMMNAPTIMRYNFTCASLFSVFWSIVVVFLVFPTSFISSFKQYSNLHVYNESLRKVHFHETIVVVVELNKDDEKLLNCEIMDVGSERDAFLKTLEGDIGPPTEFSFDDIWKLMADCENCDEFYNLSMDTISINIARKLEVSPTVFDMHKGIAPGTFWCGAGNLALNYYDLGHQRNIDKCCRKHDVCPVKVLSKETRYNLFNDTPYTRSHCKCDDDFCNCLKTIGSKDASRIGKFYFDVIEMECVNDNADGTRSFRKAIRW